MANLRDLKSRIGTIKSIKQITNAMKMVAASKLRKAQDAVTSARPYASHIDKMLRLLQKRNPTTKHPLLESVNPNGKELLVIVTSDRGLCGSFNSSIIRFSTKYLEKNPNCDLLFFGRRGFDFFRKKNMYSIIDHFENLSEMSDVLDLDNVKDKILELYGTNEYANVFVIYNEFKSAIQQNLVRKQIIPVVPFECVEDESHVDFIYEPDAASILEELGNKYVSVELWRILLESNAAEQGSRMTAMDNATTNADDLMENLSLIYNRERQSQITTQIIEVASGAEAINN